MNCKTFQIDLSQVKEHASEIQTIFCLKSYVIEGQRIHQLETNAKNPKWPKILLNLKNAQFLSNQATIRAILPTYSSAIHFCQVSYRLSKNCGFFSNSVFCASLDLSKINSEHFTLIEMIL